MFILGNPHGEENPSNFFRIDSIVKYNAKYNDLSHREITPRTSTKCHKPYTVKP